MQTVMLHFIPVAWRCRRPGQALVKGAAVLAAFVCTFQALADGASSAATSTLTQRCGWFDNPSPGNATLIDSQGEWVVGQQGGHQATGAWPQLAGPRWVRTGTGSAGYGCACLKVRANDQTHEIDAIVSTSSRPLSSCRSDAALKGKEPFNPLK